MSGKWHLFKDAHPPEGAQFIIYNPSSDALGGTPLPDGVPEGFTFWMPVKHAPLRHYRRDRTALLLPKVQIEVPFDELVSRMANLNVVNGRPYRLPILFNKAQGEQLGISPHRTKVISEAATAAGFVRDRDSKGTTWTMPPKASQ